MATWINCNDALPTNTNSVEREYLIKRKTGEYRLAYYSTHLDMWRSITVKKYGTDCIDDVFTTDEVEKWMEFPK